MHNIENETELLQASLAGNAEAFGAIVEQYQSLICGITYSATGDFAKSQDLAQETFVKAWKGLARLEDLNKFRAWLCTIARNLVKSTIRNRHRDVIGAAKSLRNAAAVETGEPGPGEAAITKEQQAVVWQALQGIPPAYREPMILFYRQEQSVSQVAAGLGMSEDAVKQRLLRGRKLLRAEVAVLVRDVLGRTGPNKAFTVAVVAVLPSVVPQAANAAIAGLAAKGSAAAKSVAALSLAGAVLMPLLNLLGSIIGLRANIANTSSPREREFMKRKACLGLVSCIGGMATILFLWWTWFRDRHWPVVAMFAAYLAVVFVMAYLNAQKRKAIQIEEGTYIVPSRRVKTKGQIYGELSGAVFSSLIWIHLISVQAEDWTSVWLALLIGVLSFVVAAGLSLRYRHHYYRIAAGTFAFIGLVTLLIVNVRWERWMSVLGDKPKYRDLCLWHVNLAVGAFILVLILMFLLIDLHNRKNKPHNKNALPQKD